MKSQPWLGLEEAHQYLCFFYYDQVVMWLAYLITCFVLVLKSLKTWKTSIWIFTESFYAIRKIVGSYTSLHCRWLYSPLQCRIKYLKVEALCSLYRAVGYLGWPLGSVTGSLFDIGITLRLALCGSRKKFFSPHCVTVMLICGPWCLSV